MFNTIDDAYRPEAATRAGFTHLASSAKQNRLICSSIEERVKRDLPRFYERASRYARSVLHD
jgi:hypothetical protein